MLIRDQFLDSDSLLLLSDLRFTVSCFHDVLTIVSRPKLVFVRDEDHEELPQSAGPRTREGRQGPALGQGEGGRAGRGSSPEESLCWR